MGLINGRIQTTTLQPTKIYQKKIKKKVKVQLKNGQKWSMKFFENRKNWGRKMIKKLIDWLFFSFWFSLDLFVVSGGNFYHFPTDTLPQRGPRFSALVGPALRVPWSKRVPSAGNPWWDSESPRDNGPLSLSDATRTHQTSHWACPPGPWRYQSRLPARSHSLPGSLNPCFSSLTLNKNKHISIVL